MVPDWETTEVYVSDLLPRKYPETYVAIAKALQSYGIPLTQLKNTKDIWCRDYMPVQMSDTRYIQFTYNPDYLVGYNSLRTKPITTHPLDDFNLDGGNIVGCRTTAIITDKIYKENPHLSRTEVRDHLFRVFQSNVTIIPKPPFDYIGHADGVVRFVDEKTVFVNECTREEKPYGDKVVALLKRTGLKVELFPYYYIPPPKNPMEIDTAVGVYLNYLRVGNVILLPIFDVEMDRTAILTLERFLPQAKICPIPARRLAEDGGVLNCATWTTKGSQAANLLCQ